MYWVLFNDYERLLFDLIFVGVPSFPIFFGVAQLLGDIVDEHLENDRVLEK
jgi:hypothetical protein